MRIVHVGRHRNPECFIILLQPLNELLLRRRRQSRAQFSAPALKMYTLRDYYNLLFISSHRAGRGVTRRHGGG